MRVLIFSVTVIIFFGLLQILFFRLFHKDWWQKRWLRNASWTLPLIGIIGVSGWAFGEYRAIDLITFPSATLAVLAFILEFALILSLPVSGLLRLFNFIIDKIRQRVATDDTPVDTRRRQIIGSTAAAVPLVALSAGAVGMIRAESYVDVSLRRIALQNLPEELNGFRILHLSDIHLRHYVTLDDLETVLTDAEPFKPDLTLVTGDIADDLSKLSDALKMIDQLNSPLGAYASLGNHEYFRGVDNVMSIFDKAPVPLFVDKGITLNHNKYPIFIGGIDDPRRMGPKEHSFFRTTIDKMMVDAPSDIFSILMSHRPDALDYASETGINLVLAGHTHGGQIGLGDRSLFESFWPDRYLWGEYRRKNTTLYTSSGVGHWFPFRLGCPAEAPVIELVKA